MTAAENSHTTTGEADALPEWPTRTIGVLATVDDAPHAIPSRRRCGRATAGSCSACTARAGR
jgi:hypothetical protein